MILDTNEYYQANQSRWEFYLRSYMGGNDYADGKYLMPYINESEAEYDKRIASTPCDNHCKNIVQIYNSFLWRIPPTRKMPKDEVVDRFLNDADLEGRSFNAFMREAGTWASVYGHCWIMVDKQLSIAETRQDELDQGLRPYLSLFTPENVIDWKYERSMSGQYVLTRLVLVEKGGEVKHIREWTPELIRLWEVSDDEERIIDEIENPIGIIPAVALYANRTHVRGIGLSDLSDIADFQRAIYCELSEVEQLIRISNHPSLAKTESTDASAGAGGIVNMSDDLDSGLKPYLLQPSASSLDGLMKSIESKIQAINRISHVGGVRVTETRGQSGVALQTEFQLLNTRLSEKADLLELAEEQIWSIFARWQEMTVDIEIDYPNSFDIRDYSADLTFLQMAKSSAIQSPSFNNGVDSRIAELVLDGDELVDALSEISTRPALADVQL